MIIKDDLSLKNDYFTLFIILINLYPEIFDFLFFDSYKDKVKSSI